MVGGSQFSDALPGKLAPLMSDEHATVDWSSADLAAIYRHQRSTPLPVDLGALPAGEANRLRMIAQSYGLVLKNIDDLLAHDNPPIELLSMLKDFAKHLMQHPASPLPRDVASMLYWVSIAAGIVRHSARLTTLADADLREGFDWAKAQSWIDEPSRALLGAASGKLATGGGG